MPLLAPLTVGGKWFCRLGLPSTFGDCRACPDDDLRVLPNGSPWRWAAALILGPLSFEKSFPGNSDAYSNKEPPTCSYSLPCTDEKLGPRAQGDMVTVSTGRQDIIVGSPIIPFPWPGTGCRPLSYSSGASPSTSFASVSSGLNQSPHLHPTVSRCHFCHLEPCTLFWKLHPEPLPLPLSVYVLLCSQSWAGGSRLIQGVTLPWPLCLVQGLTCGQVRTHETNRLALWIPGRRPFCPFTAGLDPTGSRVWVAKAF